MDTTENTRGTDPDLVVGGDDDHEPEADTASGGAPEEPDTSPETYGKPPEESGAQGE